MGLRLEGRTNLLRESTPMSKPQVLFVDDEPAILASFARAFAHQFEIRTARSGAEALAFLGLGYAPAVAVVDQQMPGMCGVDALATFAKTLPDTVRIMLTGQADLATAIEAVNRGRVFRFLTKPVSLPMLQEALNAAVEVYRLREEEHVLIAKAMEREAGDGGASEASALQRVLEARLTPRELEVLRLLGQGRVSKDIGPMLGISHRTVDVHRCHILEKMGLHNTTSLVHLAVKAGLA